MKKILFVIISLAVIALTFTGCLRSNAEEIESLISQVSDKLTSVEAAATDIADSDIHSDLADVREDFEESSSLYKTTKGDKDTEILEELKECSIELDKIQNRINTVKNRPAAQNNPNEIQSLAAEVYANALKLAPYMTDGLSKGYLDSKRLAQFNEICEELDEISNETDADREDEAEVKEMKSQLAVMASQCAAPNDIVDLFVDTKSMEEYEAESISAASGSNSVSQKAKSAYDEAVELSESFTLLQNEASRKYDLGEITHDEYRKLLQTGTSLNNIKAALEKNSSDKNAASQLADCKKEIYNTAKNMNSDLAERFK